MSNAPIFSRLLCPTPFFNFRFPLLILRILLRWSTLRASMSVRMISSPVPARRLPSHSMPMMQSALSNSGGIYRRRGRRDAIYPRLDSAFIQKGLLFARLQSAGNATIFLVSEATEKDSISSLMDHIKSPVGCSRFLRRRLGIRLSKNFNLRGRRSSFEFVLLLRPTVRTVRSVRACCRALRGRRLASGVWGRGRSPLNDLCIAAIAGAS